MRFVCMIAIAAMISSFVPHSLHAESGSVLEIAGITVTPHMQLDTMRYAKAPDPAIGARIQLFLRNTAAAGTPSLTLDSRTRALFDGKTPMELLDQNIWSWHDSPGAIPEESVTLDPGGLTVWTFNARSEPFVPGGSARVDAGPEGQPWLSAMATFDRPQYWLSAITFLGPDDALYPDTMVVHIANASADAVKMRSCRLWLPRDPKMPQALYAQPLLAGIEPFHGHAEIGSGDRGGFTVTTGPLALTYVVVEVMLEQGSGQAFSLWGRLRIKPERFDISGGWVNMDNAVTHEIFLKTLKRFHVNTAHIAFTPGYCDTPLYERYPIKYFNKLTPFETYDTDEMLPRIHAVEFLGEPQYGGGRPAPPQEVWRELRPYAVTRLATTVTHSDERIWRDYAGLSDYPHYNAYRVTAPSPDLFHKYDRWGGKRIHWGAPLETIGDMCRSLRELNRPAPCAIWSQGPHDDWDRYGGRKRTSPTPDEIRLQAYHALSTRITSLYWFNLSLGSIVKWRDTLEELTRIGREIRMLDQFMLEGDAYGFERVFTEAGAPDWDIASVCGPRAALLYALDLDYVPDPDERVFRFGDPRKAQWKFALPAYLRDIKDVFRVDADGVYDTAWSANGGAVEIKDTASRVAVYVATGDPQLRARVEEKRLRLIAEEAALQFDPANNDADFNQLLELRESLKTEVK